jgi:hypothetical protein
MPNGRCRMRAGKSSGVRKGNRNAQTLGLHSIVTAADVQDRDGGIALLTTLFGLFPFLEKLVEVRSWTKTLTNYHWL